MRAAWLLVFAVGCGGPTEVDCVLGLDPSIDPAASTVLDIIVAGDESYRTSIDLPHGFPTDGARFVYRPAISSGTLVFYFDVADSSANKFGEASTTNVQLKPHGGVELDLTLRPLVASGDMEVPADGGALDGSAPDLAGAD
jgi:hypothetical protein